MSTQPDANSVSLGELESLCKPRVEPECLRNNEGPGYGEKTNFIWGGEGIIIKNASSLHLRIRGILLHSILLLR